MSATVKDTLAARALKAISMRDAAGTIHAVNVGKVRDAGNVQRLFFTSMQASITPAEIKKTQFAFFAGMARTAVTPAATINVTGGVPPYTFAWTRLSGDAALLADTPTAQTTIFKAAMVSPQFVSAVFEGKVTDSVGAIVTNKINVSYDLKVSGS